MSATGEVRVLGSKPMWINEGSTTWQNSNYADLDSQTPFTTQQPSYYHQANSAPTTPSYLNLTAGPGSGMVGIESSQQESASGFNASYRNSLNGNIVEMESYMRFMLHSTHNHSSAHGLPPLPPQSQQNLDPRLLQDLDDPISKADYEATLRLEQQRRGLLASQTFVSQHMNGDYDNPVTTDSGTMAIPSFLYDAISSPLDAPASKYTNQDQHVSNSATSQLSLLLGRNANINGGLASINENYMREAALALMKQQQYNSYLSAYGMQDEEEAYLSLLNSKTYSAIPPPGYICKLWYEIIYSKGLK
ncbi:hypothetical protein HK098_001174 [Nowakowskiella sp. JEL0407]|nr:hypothetical protein HK098_001174 [Nowakowskiella sp. JEL0407]